MPYIDEDGRVKIRSGIFPKNCGQLNYRITKICHDYLATKLFHYKDLNEVIGVLECCKQELYRQVVAPYERKKHKLNGSVSELDKDGQ